MCPGDAFEMSLFSLRLLELQVKCFPVKRDEVARYVSGWILFRGLSIFFLVVTLLAA